MANYYHQSLLIKGNQKTVEEIISRLNEGDGFVRFSNLVPIPSDEELNELELSKTEWCEKWYEVALDFGILREIEITENEGIIHFDTRNSPCRQFVYQLCQKYINMNFYLSFYEPYGGFHGYVEYENSEVLQEYFGEIDVEDIKYEPSDSTHVTSEKSEENKMSDIGEFLDSL